MYPRPLRLACPDVLCPVTNTSRYNVVRIRQSTFCVGLKGVGEGKLAIGRERQE